MEKDEHSKKLLIGTILFFIAVILLAGFVGRQLVKTVRASMDPNQKLANQNLTDETVPSQAEEKGGYPSITPFFADTPTPTATLPPTNTPTSTPPNTPTNTPTSTPTNTATVTKTPATPPTVGAPGNPQSYIGAGVIFAFLALLSFGFYFFHAVQVNRERKQ